MNTERLRIRIAKILDEYVGKACIWSGARLGFFSKSRMKDKAINKVLFIKFWGIGSIILSEPALRRIHELYPDVEIHYLTLRNNEDLFLMIPFVSRVFCLDFALRPGSVRGLLDLIVELRKQQYDLIFDGEFFVHISAILAKLARPVKVIGFGRNHSMKSKLLDECVAFRDNSHTVEQFLNLVNFGQNQLIEQSLIPSPQLVLREPFIGHSRSILPNGPFVVLNINASSLAIERRWPRDRFLILAEAILIKMPHEILLIGSQKEFSYVEPLAQRLEQHGRVRNLAGRLDLAGLAYVIKHAQALISNDSGPIHMAAAFDTPTVGFYGPETPTRYGPLSARHLVFYQGLWCSPCMSADNAKTVNCINNLMCMKSIEAAVVIEKVCGFLQEWCMETGRPHIWNSQSSPKAGINTARLTVSLEN